MRTEEERIIEELILEREFQFKCLSCGEDLSNDIMNNKIRLHLCRECRMSFMKKFESLKPRGAKP